MQLIAPRCVYVRTLRLIPSILGVVIPCMLLLDVAVLNCWPGLI